MPANTSGCHVAVMLPNSLCLVWGQLRGPQASCCCAGPFTFRFKIITRGQKQVILEVEGTSTTKKEAKQATAALAFEQLLANHEEFQRVAAAEECGDSSAGRKPGQSRMRQMKRHLGLGADRFTRDSSEPMSKRFRSCGMLGAGSTVPMIVPPLSAQLQQQQQQQARGIAELPQVQQSSTSRLFSQQQCTGGGTYHQLPAHAYSALPAAPLQAHAPYEQAANTAAAAATNQLHQICPVDGQYQIPGAPQQLPHAVPILNEQLNPLIPTAWQSAPVNPLFSAWTQPVAAAVPVQQLPPHQNGSHPQQSVYPPALLQQQPASQLVPVSCQLSAHQQYHLQQQQLHSRPSQLPVYYPVGNDLYRQPEWTQGDAKQHYVQSGFLAPGVPVSGTALEYGG